MGLGAAVTFTLCHHGSSVRAAKVRFAMAEKGIEWDGVYIDILAGEQFASEYQKLTPKSVVPTLVRDDLVITDSTVIVEYLDGLYPDTSLHPACDAVTFVCSHRHTVLRNLGPEGAKQFLASTPEFSVFADWNTQKDMFVRLGFDAPEAPEKITLYDSYLHRMETALEGNDWLVGMINAMHRLVTVLCQGRCRSQNGKPEMHEGL